jgi:hypothetical protein
MRTCDLETLSSQQIEKRAAADRMMGRRTHQDQRRTALDARGN